MSFHGALIGIVVGTYFFSIKRNIKIFFLLDILACVSPVGIFFGRIANFINGELIGKTTDVYWSVIFPNIDNVARHPSQLYEAFLEGILLLILMNLIIFKKNYKIGTCSFMFLIFYGLFRIISEFFREPDAQIGYLFNIVSMGMFLSALMIATGIIIFLRKRNDN
jgi:phosphatidylglycerol:prolipoprotein diacylglycerol transferase